MAFDLFAKKKSKKTLNRHSELYSLVKKLT